MPFDHSQIEQDSTEFYVVLKRSPELCYQIPVAKAVRKILCDVFAHTLGTLSKLKNLGSIDYSEKYSPMAHLTCDISDPTVTRLVDIYNSQNAISSTDALSTPSNIDFYFVRFFDREGKTCVGVKNPRRFKAEVGKNIMSLVDGQLQIIEDRVFKLDEEFDFVIYDDEIEILKPSQFMYVADVDKVLKDKAPEYVGEIALKMPFVNFSSIVACVTNKKRAQQLVFALRKSPYLLQMTFSDLQTLCTEHEVPIVEVNGFLQPEPGREMDFLQFLEGRRYKHPLSKSNPEHLVALSKRKA